VRVARRVGVEERRARLARRHHLAAACRAGDPVEVARDLVALHATDPATVHLAAAARLREPAVEPVERALYDERVLLRLLGMRRTMFVVPVELAPVVQAACTQAIAARERRRQVELLQGAELGAEIETWLAEVEEATIRALAARGQATAAELAADVPGLRQQVMMAAGKRYGGLVNMTNRVLMLLAAEGRIVRGRPRGSWISSQYRWSPMEAWLPGGMAELAPDQARVELVRAWLRAYGPGTVADLRWWTGCTAGEVGRALLEVGPVEVELDGETGLLLAEDAEPVERVEPWVALLPALDPTVMGWSRRGWFLGEHGPALFDRSGNPGPTVWWDGRIVGGWAQRRDGQVAARLLEDVGAEAASAVEAEAERLGQWLGPVRVTPRFRTPLERALLT
jgi:hypothetical protein